MKDSVITLRLTREDKQLLQEKAKKENTTISEIIRSFLKYENTDNRFVKGSLTKSNRELCSMMTDIGKLEQEYPDIDLKILRERGNKLWQLLK